MTDQGLVTECPNCQTRFRVNKEQLDIANGRVRCGACLSVFDGESYLLGETDTEEVESVPSRGGGGLLETMLAELARNNGQPSAQPLDDEPTEGDWRDRSVDTSQLAADTGEGVSINDALDDEEALRGWLDEELNRGGEQDPAKAAQDVELELEVLKREIQGTDFESDLKEIISNSGSETFEQLENLLQELGEDEPVPPAESPAAPNDAFFEPPAAVPDLDDDRDDTVAEAREEARADIASELRWADAALTETIETVEPVSPTVEVSPGAGDGPAWLPAWLRGATGFRAATAVALVLLIVQVLYLQFDSWGKSSAMRPVYGAICALLPCELPVRRSVARLVSRKLTVRKHPSRAGMLLIDALIVNEAAFEQPYPTIELQFTDVRQEPVRAFRFRPDEYLAGAFAAPGAMMAVNTPIHIDIEVDDPGPSAVNYQLIFR
ncbi:MAG: DUF3426 domain-containing protein [Pseudomonadota bacterium]